MKLPTLSEWLAKISAIHFSEVDLGLKRITQVANALSLLPINTNVVMVGGTNGKGSTVAALEAIYLKAGYNVGCYTSPILFKHNEQVRINQQSPSDATFCAAFEEIESARGDITLTAFEFHTLAALLIFRHSPDTLDVIILEVGMGGRLDAVNMVDSDVAIVTSIDIDHAQWLGDTREKIACEKAGIYRANKPAICGDANPPATLKEIAQQKHAIFYQQGKDFKFTLDSDHWSWQAKEKILTGLPFNSLLTDNLSTALMAVECLQNRLPVTDSDIKQALRDLKLIGRMQVVDGDIQQIFDVSHNPAAVRLLAQRLQAMPSSGQTIAVFSMLADKDIKASVAAIKDKIDEWYIAPLNVARAASVEEMTNVLKQQQISNVHTHDSIASAYQAALQNAKSGDRIIVFGSFHTVAGTLSS